MRGLRRFSFSISYHYSADPTISQLLEGLRYCPLLEYLEIGSPNSAYLPTDQAPKEIRQNGPPVQLPHLKHLRLTGFIRWKFVALSCQLDPMNLKDLTVELNIKVMAEMQPWSLLFEHLCALARNRTHSLPDDRTMSFGAEPRIYGLVTPNPSSSPTSRDNFIDERQRQEQRHKYVICMTATSTVYAQCNYLAHTQVHLMKHLCTPRALSLNLSNLADWAVGDWGVLLSCVPRLQSLALSGGNLTALRNLLEAISSHHAWRWTPQDRSERRQESHLQHLRLSRADLSVPVLSLYPTQDQDVALQTFLTRVLKGRKQYGLQITKLTLRECKSFEETSAPALRESVQELHIC